MKLSGWLLVLLLLTPFAVRLATWERAGYEPPDPNMAAAGKVLFEHEWKPGDPLSPEGDGLGPVFNAASCVACHRQGGAGGGGPSENNVLTFVVLPVEPGQTARQGVVHARAVRPQFRENLTQVDPRLPAELPRPRRAPSSMPSCVVTPFAFPREVLISERNTPALFGANLIEQIPERAIIAEQRRQRLKWGLADTGLDDVPVGRVSRLPDGRVGRFGWKGQTATLGEFVRAACANELGLGNPDKPQPAPLPRPNYQPPGLDLTDEQCDQMTAFVASLPRPEELLPDDSGLAECAEAGRRLFGKIGCADCHTPDLGGVSGIYSDLLLHRMGQDLQGGGSYDPPPDPGPDPVPTDDPDPSEWRTPPLWGVADSPPYLHDGRAATLQEAIELHGGQGEVSAKRFRELPAGDKTKLIAFLETLRAPQADMTNDQ